jgi:hypothetical protein
MQTPPRSIIQRLIQPHLFYVLKLREASQFNRFVDTAGGQGSHLSSRVH